LVAAIEGADYDAGHRFPSESLPSGRLEVTNRRCAG
jgi:hypothetical protein